ncbi:MAG: exonuclease SbcC, partial [Gammaproteobacteria bacterium]
TEARLGAARARAAATGLPGEGLSDEELDVLDKAGQTLIKARERRDRVASSLASSSKLLAELSGAGLPEAAPTREDIQSLEEGLKMLRRAESRVIEQGAYVDAMTGEEGDELSPKIALAQQFVRLVVFLACVQIAAGVYLKDQGLPGILLLAGGALTLILAWCIRAPLAELRGLTAERDVLRRAAERRLARDERLAEEAKQAQSTRLEEFGLDAAWGGLDLVNLEARLAQRREAQTSLVESRASLEESEEQELLARQSLARVIDPLMEALVIDGEVRRGALSEDAAALLQVTERLRGREAERRRAADSIPELEARREAGQREVEEAARALRRFFQENGVPDGDVAGLRERLAAHPRWREMSEALRDAERDARDGRDALGSSEALLGEQMDVLEARARELRETRDRRDELVSQVAELQLRLDQTSRGNALAEARRAERAARAQLAGMRDTALIGAAANVLLSDVEEEHRREVRDGVVPRASRAFARFTDGEYRLEAPLASSREAAGEAALGCVVRSSETGLLVAPSSLSNGTRAQLLLALRVALAEELEGPDPLPLFLDEVLATSDPRRLEAVVKSLAELVMAGRQVILLTADPVVAARVTDALGTDQELLRIVDVDAARDRDAMILTAKELVAPRMRANPDPSAFASAEDYAEAIGVAQADPFQQAASLHPFHLLRDELPAVQALRSHHLESSGRALRALDDELPHGLAQGQAELLRRRVLLAQAFLDAWRVGRMPKLRTEFLRGSALKRSGKYVGAVLDVAADLDWDGRALIDALTTRSDPRLKGFRQTITEDLRAELEAAGYWTDATPLQGAELQREALERASTSGIAADPRELERLSTWLLV